MNEEEESKARLLPKYVNHFSGETELDSSGRRRFQQRPTLGQSNTNSLMVQSNMKTSSKNPSALKISVLESVVAYEKSKMSVTDTTYKMETIDDSKTAS